MGLILIVLFQIHNYKVDNLHIDLSTESAFSIRNKLFWGEDNISNYLRMRWIVHI